MHVRACLCVLKPGFWNKEEWCGRTRGFGIELNLALDTSAHSPGLNCAYFNQNTLLAHVYKI